MNIKRGDIFLANFEPVKGKEQGGIRPVLIIQNDISNEFSPTTVIAPITSARYDKEYPTNITAIKYFEKTKEEDFLHYGSCHKNLYLILLEDL